MGLCQSELCQQERKIASHRWIPPDLLCSLFPGALQTLERMPGLAKDHRADLTAEVGRAGATGER